MLPRPIALVLSLLLCAGAAQADDYFLATSYFRQGKYQKTLEAIDRLEKAEGATAISPSLLFVKAQCLANLEKPKEAIETLDDLLKRFPHSSFTNNARNKMAQVLEDQKSYKPLIERLSAWAGEDSTTTTWSRLLARAYVKDGRPDDAIRYLAGSRDPRNTEVLFEVLTETGKLDAYLKEAERTADGTADGERRLGLLQGSAKNWAKARPHLEKARAQQPGDTELLSRMIGLAQEAKDLESAIRYARELATAEPANMGHVKRLGELQLAAGKREDALGTWNQLRTRNQRDRSAHLAYSNVLADHGLVEEAITGIEGARKVFDDPSLFAEELGRLHERKGNHYQATREYLHLFDQPGEKAPQLVLAMVRRAAPKAGAPEAAPQVRVTLGTPQTPGTLGTPQTPGTTSTAPSPATTAPSLSSSLQPPASSLPWPALADAIRAIFEATRSRPSSIQLYYLLDDLYQLAPDPEKIRDLCRDLVRANTARTDAVVKAARDFAAERRYLEARTVLTEVLPHLQPPDSWETTLELARLERQAGQTDTALELLVQLGSATAPESVVLAARTLTAEIHLSDRKDAAAARAILDDLLRRYPEAQARAQWTFLVARCALARLEIGEAFRLLAEVENAADGSLMPEVLFRQAQIDLMVDRVDEGRDRLQTIIVKYPASPLAQGALRDIFFLSTRKAELAKEEPAPATPGSPAPGASPAPSAAPSAAPSPAASAASAPPTALPDKPTLIAEYFIQRHLLEAGRFDELERRTKPIDPAKLPPGLKADFQMLSAQARRARGDPAGAVDALEKLAKNLPEGPVLEDALILRAEILEKDLHDRTRAAEVYEEYLMLYPTSVRAEEVRRKLEGDGAGTISGQGGGPEAQ